MRSLFSILFGILTTAVATCQSPGYFNYAIQDGMPSNEVYSIHVDDDGFLWFCTDNGVVKFDGFEKRLFHVKDGMVDPVVFDIAEDFYGRLWFKSFSGKLCYYEAGKIEHYKYNKIVKDSIGISFLNSIYSDSLNRLWFAAGGRIRMVDSTGQMTMVAKLPHKSIGYMEQGQGFLMDVTYHLNELELLVINGKQYHVKVTDTTRYNNVIRKVLWRNKLYISAQTDLFEFSDGKVRRAYSAEDLIISISVDRNDNLWIGYKKGGAKMFNNESFSNPLSIDFLAGKSVSDVASDRDGGLWFSTIESGVFSIPNMSIKNYQLPIRETITDVTTAGQHILVGDVRGNVFKLSDKRLSLLYTLNSNIFKFFEDSRNNIWISTTAHLNILSPDLAKIKTASFLRAYVNFSQHQSEANVWAAERYLDSYDLDVNQTSSNIFNERFRNLLSLDSIVLLAGRVGLFKVNKKSFQLGELNHFTNDKISTLLRLTDSTIFVGTIGNGFHIISNNFATIKSFKADSNFVSSNIYSTIVTDSTLWIGTENGLHRVAIRSLTDKLPTLYTLHKEDGLAGSKVDFLAHDSRNIYAFFNNVISVIPKNEEAFNHRAPIFYITNTLVNNTERGLDNQELLHTENNIQIDFGFISYSNKDIFVRYRLSPEDAWTYTTDRVIQLFALGPGNYSIQIEYSNDHAHWVEIPTQASFTILPPVWRRAWFLVAVVVSILLIAFGFFRNRLSIYRQRDINSRLVHEHQQELLKAELETLERERSRIARDLHDGIGVDISAVKMTVSQLLKDSPEAGAVEKNLQRIMSDIKSIIFGLSPPGLQRYGLMETFKTYVTKIDSPGKTISLNTFGKPQLSELESINIFRILQELIANSVKHSNGENIIISINAFEDILSIMYEDDGKGFDHSMAKRGLGLNNIETRIQSVRGNLTFESGEFGTTYLIDLPTQRRHEQSN